MKKRLFTLFLTGVMVLSLAACGGSKDNETKSPVKQQEETAGNENSEDIQEAEDSQTDKETLKSIEVSYGTTHYEMFTDVFYCPEGAYIDEDDVEGCEAGEIMYSFTVYDDVREYTAYVRDYQCMDSRADKRLIGYGVLQQLYFEGVVAEETAATYESFSQKITDLGFQWDGKDVILIETKTTVPEYPEHTDIFVGVEYELDYWHAKEGGGIDEHLHGPGLIGFEMYSTGLDDLTEDQCAWIAGQMFGVDSGRAWPVEGEETEPETEAPVVNVKAEELLGKWLEPDSSWKNTYTFHADGSGSLKSGPEYEFTYEISGNILTLIYGEDDEESFEVTVDGDTMIWIDKFRSEILLERIVEEQTVTEAEPEEDIVEVEASPLHFMQTVQADTAFTMKVIMN